MLVRNLRKINPLLRSLRVSRGPGFEPDGSPLKIILPPTANEQTASHSDDAVEDDLDNPFRCDPDFPRNQQTTNRVGQRVSYSATGRRMLGQLDQADICSALENFLETSSMELARESPSYKSVASPVFCPSYLLKEKAHAQRQLVCSATIGRLISE